MTNSNQTPFGLQLQTSCRDWVFGGTPVAGITTEPDYIEQCRVLGLSPSRANREKRPYFYVVESD
jgi:hypothetical protein